MTQLAVAGGAKSRGTTRNLMTFLARRIVQGVLTILAVSMVVFAATQALPGNVATVILGHNATPDQVASLRAKLGLDRPVVVQYWDWLSGLLTGDLGTSLANRVSVSSMLGGRVLNSLILTGTAMVFAIPVAMLLGMYSALRRDRLADKTFMGASMLVNSLPDFVVGTLLIVIFSTSVFHLFPPVSLVRPGMTALSEPSTLVLPAMTMGLYATTYLGRLVRASFIDVLDSEYVQAARLRGLPTRTVIFAHALPNAIGASIPAASVVAANTLAGVVVVEYLFGYPGMGSLLVSGVTDHDLPIIQAIVILMSAVFYILNLLADVLSEWNSSGARA